MSRETTPEAPEGDEAPSPPPQQWLARRSAEALLIVTSILLAFGIDAAWELRQEAIIEEQVLAAIRQDMEVNEALLEDNLGAAEARLDRVSRFLEAVPSQLASMPEDSTDLILFSLYTESTFQPVYGSLSTSNLTVVSDLKLRNELSSWFGHIEDLRETAPYQIDGSLELMERAGGTDALLTAAPMMGLEIDAPSSREALRRLRGDRTFVHAAFRNRWIRGIAVGKLSRLMESTQTILDHLRSNGPR